ncbi:MAG: hypothetical protein EZS28_033951 [Streblomastix strix]|uniref:Uncharacterized protein n=1 Tax=Streblomastix strix TaxID=222440 RepID=A0A5J4UKI7_9EUKA|nr:MAG: hypothetical protein EZS28_033951 [Streblomastix strix]
MDHLRGHEIQVGQKRDFNKNIAWENQYREGQSIWQCNDSALDIIIDSSDAVALLREGINLPYQFRVVAGNNVLPTDIITKDTLERIKRNTEQMNLEYLAAALAKQCGTQILPQLCSTNPLLYIAPSYLYNQVQKYQNQQPDGSPRKEKEFQGMWRGKCGRRHGGFQTNVQTGVNAFATLPHNP